MATLFNIKIIRDKLTQVYAKSSNDPSIQIYEGRVNDPDKFNPIDFWTDISQTEALDRLQYIEDNYCGVFTFFIRNKKTESYSSAQKLVVQVGEDVSNNRSMNGGQSIQKQIHDAIHQFKMEQKISDLEKQLKEKNNESVPWGFYANQAFSKFVMGQEPVKQINGTKQAPVNGTAEDEEKASEALNASFNTILDALGEENVHKLAILTQNEQLVQQFITYLNSINI